MGIDATILLEALLTALEAGVFARVRSFITHDFDQRRGLATVNP